MASSNGSGATATFLGLSWAYSSLMAETIFLICAWPNSRASATASSETSRAPDSTMTMASSVPAMMMMFIIAGTDEAIVMVESGALEVSEEAVADALEFGHAQIKKIVSAIKELYAQLKPKKV